MATDTALVTITVDATVQANDDTATTAAGTPVTVPILANDIVNGVTGPTVADLDGPPTILSITPEDAGTATVNEDGEIEFTPAAGFCGQVQVEYSIEKSCQASCDTVVVLGGSANINSTPFEAPGFEWGVTPMFGLFHPDLGETAYFEWDGGEGVYFFAAASIPCGDENPQPGWTLEVDGAAPFDVCVMAGCS